MEMKKSRCLRMLALMLCFLMIASYMPIGQFGSVYADTEESFTEGDWTYTVSNNEATITKYTGEDEVMVIPDTLGGYPVIKLDYDFMSGKTAVKDVTVPESVRIIHAYAFYNTSINTLRLNCTLDPAEMDERGLVPSSVVTLYIGPNAGTAPYYTDPNGGNYSTWNDGYDLQRFVVDENNPYFADVDGVLFSKDLTELMRFPRYCPYSEYTVPDGTVRIGDQAFSRSVYLTEIHIPESVTDFGENVFGENSNSVSDRFLIYTPEGSAAETYAVNAELKLGVKPTEEAEKKDQSTRTVTSGGTTNYWNGTDSKEVQPVGKQYSISTAAELKWLSDQVNAGNGFKGSTFILTEDIDLHNNVWTPIGTGENPFRGNFDGQKHTISNFRLPAGTSYNGLFGWVSSGTHSTTTIKNIKVENVTTDDYCDGYAAAVIGGMRTARGGKLNVSGLTVTTEDLFGNRVGGAIGRIWCGHTGSMVKVSNIKVTKSTLLMGGGTSSNGGGIIAFVDMKDHDYEDGFNGDIVIKNCKFKGQLSTDGRWGTGGGIVGSVDSCSTSRTMLIEHCRADGSVTAGSAARGGGIISGLPYGQTLKSCVNYTNVYGYDAGGITSTNSGTIDECYNEGWASAMIGGSNGGMVGSNDGTIFNSYNAGTAPNSSALAYNGAIAASGSGTVENCYNIGAVAQHVSSSTAVAHSGVFGYTSGQTLIHSYFDNIDGSYIFGNVEESGIINDANLKVTESGGMSTSKMKTSGSYTNWDFNDIWEFDLDYSWGYPTLSSIKDILKKHPDTDTKNKLKNSQYKFTVLDQDSEPVEGAVINLAEGKEGAASMTTDKLGKANTPWQDGTLGISITKEGYVPYEDSGFAMNKTGEKTFMIIDRNKADLYPICSALMEQEVTNNFGKKSNLRYELLSQSRTINRQWSVTQPIVPAQTYAPFTLKCKLTDPDKEYESVELIQGSIYSDPIAVAADPQNPVFTDLAYDYFETTDKGLTAAIGSNKAVKIRLKDKNGSTKTQKINLEVEDDASSEFDFTFDDGISITVPSSIPFVGGTKLDIPVMASKIQFSVTDDKIQFGINVKDGALKKTAEGWKRISQKDLDDDKSIANAIEEFRSYMDNPSLASKKNGMGPVKFSWSIIGYGEADLPWDKKITAHLICELKISVGGETQAYFFVVALDGSGKVSGDASWDFNFTNATLETAFLPKLENGALTVSGEIGFGAYLGVGLANFISGGVYGEPAIGLTYNVLGGDHSAASNGLADGLDELYIKGTVSAVLRVLGSNAIEYPLLSGKYDIYKWEDTDGKRASKKLMASLKAVSGDEVVPSTEESAGEWSGGSEVLQESAYSGSSPLIIRSGDDLVMLFTSNTDTDRAVSDRSMLMYSVYDRENSAWSEPAPVNDDGTADFNPAVSGKYVAWNNAKGTLADCTTYSDLGKMTEVCVAEYDAETKSFNAFGNITDNDKYENRLTIKGGSGSPVISWTTDASDNLMGLGGTNTLSYASLSGSRWTVSTGQAVDTLIVCSAAGKLGGQSVQAYVTDEDSDLTTTEDRALYISAAGGSPVKATDFPVTQVACAENSNKILAVDDQGDLYSFSSVNGEPTKETTDGRIGLGIIVQVIDDEDGNITLVMTKTENGGRNPYVMSYDSAKGTWSYPLRVLEQSCYVDGVNAWYEDGALVYAYNQRRVNIASEDGVYSETNSIKWSRNETGKAALTITDAFFYPDELAAGEDLDVRVFVENKGFKSLSKVGARFEYTADKQTVVCSDEILDREISSGTEELITAVLPVPDDAVKRDYTLTLYDPDDADVKATAVVTVGNANFQVDKEVYSIGGHEMVTAVITNTGFAAGSGQIEFYDTKSGEALDVFNFGSLNPDEIATYTFKPEDRGIAFNSLRVGIRVIDSRGNVLSSSRQAQLSSDVQLPVSGVMLDRNFAKIDNVGETLQLTAAVTPPSAAENAVLKWESSNPEAVSVNEEGLVTAVSSGRATITVYSEDDKFYDECLVYAGKKDIAECTVRNLKTRHMVGTDFGHGTYDTPIEPSFRVYDGPEELTAGVDYDYEYTNNKAIGDAHLIITGKGAYGGKIDRIFKIKSTAAFNLPDVEGFRLLKHEASLIHGTDEDEVQVYFEIDPADAGDTEVIWTSSDESVAKTSYDSFYDGKGYVYINAYGAGKCTITGTTRDGSFSDSIEITVTERVAVEDIVVGIPSDEITISLNGDDRGFYAYVLPDNAYDRSIGVRVGDGNSDESAISISHDYSDKQRFYICPESVGTETVTVYAYDNEEISKTFTVHVVDADIPGYGSISQKVYEGDENINFSLGGYEYDDDYGNYENVKYVSSDESILTVDEEGIGKALKTGEVTVTASGNYKGKPFTSTMSVRVVVNDQQVSRIYLYCYNEQIYEGETTELDCSMYPNNPRNPKLIWTSSDTNVATVDDKGIVTGISEGSATITATAEDGGASDSVDITVLKYIPVEEFSILKTEYDLNEDEEEALDLVIRPDNASIKEIDWTSSDYSVAFVRAAGEQYSVYARGPGKATITGTAKDGQTVSITVNVTGRIPIYDAEVTLSKTSYTYSGNPCRPEVEVTLEGKTLKAGVEYEVYYADNIDAGEASVMVAGIGEYSGYVWESFTIGKATRRMTLKAPAKTIKAKKVKKKAQKIKNAVIVSGAAGKVTYRITKVSKAKFKKYFSIDAAGTLTVKKKLKKGKYKVTISVTSSGNTNYNGVTQTVVKTIKVK